MVMYWPSRNNKKSVPATSVRMLLPLVALAVMPVNVPNVPATEQTW